jgi:hypothetical protein
MGQRGTLQGLQYTLALRVLGWSPGFGAQRIKKPANGISEPL